MLTIRFSQSCCLFFYVARHRPINYRHCSAFPTLWGVGGPAGPSDSVFLGHVKRRLRTSEAPLDVTEKYRKTRIKSSTRKLLVPGVPFCVGNPTRPACIHLEKKALMDLL